LAWRLAFALARLKLWPAPDDWSFVSWFELMQAAFVALSALAAAAGWLFGREEMDADRLGFRS
jgi:hypothetical protein